MTVKIRCKVTDPSVAQWLAHMTLHQWVWGLSMHRGNIKNGHNTGHFFSTNLISGILCQGFPHLHFPVLLALVGKRK